MQKFSFCRKRLNLINCSKHISVCFLCLQMQILLVNVHHKAIHIHEIIIALTRVLSLICKKISTFCTTCIQTCFLFYLTQNSFVRFLSRLSSSAGYFPPAWCPCFRPVKLRIPASDGSRSSPHGGPPPLRSVGHPDGFQYTQRPVPVIVRNSWKTPVYSMSVSWNRDGGAGWLHRSMALTPSVKSPSRE